MDVDPPAVPADRDGDRGGTGPGADQGEAGPVDVEQLARALEDGLVLARYPWTRVAWRRAARGASLYVAGQSWRLPVADAKRLAASNPLDAAGWNRLSAAGRDCVAGLIAEGHYRLEEEDSGDQDDRED